MQQEGLEAARSVMGEMDPRMLNPLQMAYIGDTVHDLYVRSRLVARGMAIVQLEETPEDTNE